VGVEIPKAVITFTNVSPPQEDIIEIKIHLGCTKEVSSFECKLQNWNGKYSPGGSFPINVGDTGGIGISRGSVPPASAPIISHRVENVEYDSTPVENYVRVSGRCWGEKLFRRVVTKTYDNQKGEAIVKDLLDNYVGLSHVRGGTELVEDTDTTYSNLKYTDSPVWDILTYIAGSADKAGVIGYDFRVAPDGKFEFFPKNSKAVLDIFGEKIEVSEYRKDISRIRNKIRVYGIADKSVPLNKDDWTEELTPADGVWTAVGTGAVVALDATNKVRGQVSVKTNINNQPIGVGCKFTLNSGKEVDANLYPILSFWSVIENTFNGHGMLTLRDITGKMASRLISAGTTDWAETQATAGASSESSWKSVAAGFDWTQIKSIQIFYYFPGAVTPPLPTASGTFWVDGLYFGGRRYSAVREDGASQTAYGLRELGETDEELWSDNECDLRAKALLAYLKSPAIYLTIRSAVIDYGTNPPLPGDTAHVLLPNEGVDSNFRIESVEYDVDALTQTLEIVLQLEKEPPQLADYLYGLRALTINVEKLARTKLGKGPYFGGGGYGSGGGGGDVFPFSAWESMIERFGLFPKTGIRWTDIWRYMPNINKSLIPASDNTYDLGESDTPLRWRNIYGVTSFLTWIGPYSDTAAVMQFRTRAKNYNQTPPLNHLFNPTDNEYGGFGSSLKHFKEFHTRFMTFYVGDPTVSGPEGGLWGYKNTATHVDDNPVVHLNKELLEFGPGGDGAPNVPDTRIKRIEPGFFELYTGFGPYSDVAAIINFRTKNKAGTTVLDHQLAPTDNEHGILGSFTKSWLEIHSKYFITTYLGYYRIWNSGEANPLVELKKDYLSFGPGGSTTLDTWMRRIDAGYFEIHSGFGPLSDSPGSVSFRTKNMAGSAIVEHQFIPTDDEHGLIGSETKQWKEVHSAYFFFPDTGYVRCQLPGENALIQLKKDALEFGPGGAVAPDVYLKRIGADSFELKALFLQPAGDNVTELGSATKRFKKLYLGDAEWTSDLNVNKTTPAINLKTGGVIKATFGHDGTNTFLSAQAGDLVLSGASGVVRPYADATYDLGTASFRWSGLYVAGVCDFGWLNTGGYTIITNARVLQNVTANTAVITSGRFPLARLPESSAGYVLEAQGAGFDPTYVNPNGRYAPAGHDHAAGNITSGVLAEARCPNVYSGQITFQGGIITNSVNCKNWQLADLEFLNKFVVTEAWFADGLVFLNPKKKIIAFLDSEGNLEISGKLTENSVRLKKLNQERGFA